MKLFDSSIRTEESSAKRKAADLFHKVTQSVATAAQETYEDVKARSEEHQRGPRIARSDAAPRYYGSFDQTPVEPANGRQFYRP